jgi:quinol monooxygenase YgiN
MSQPFIFISTFRVKPGNLEAFKGMCQALVEFVESNEPGVIAFNLYASEDGTEVSNVQVHPDADSMVSHMQLLHEHISGAGGEEGPIDVTASNQIYGVPNDAVLGMIEKFDPGVPFTIKPLPLAGFTRSAAGEAQSAT